MTVADLKEYAYYCDTEVFSSVKTGADVQKISSTIGDVSMDILNFVYIQNQKVARSS